MKCFDLRTCATLVICTFAAIAHATVTDTKAKITDLSGSVTPQEVYPGYVIDNVAASTTVDFSVAFTEANTWHVSVDLTISEFYGGVIGSVNGNGYVMSPNSTTTHTDSLTTQGMPGNAPYVVDCMAIMVEMNSTGYNVTGDDEQIILP